MSSTYQPDPYIASLGVAKTPQQFAAENAAKAKEMATQPITTATQTPTPTPPAKNTNEPTVLSSSSPSGRIQELTSDVTKAFTTPKGDIVGPTGFVHDVSGNLAEAPSDATQTTDPTTGQTYYTKDGLTYAVKGGNDPDTQASLDLLNSAKSKADANGAAQIESIKSMYQSLIDEQRRTNAGTEAGLNSLLVSGGSYQTASGGTTMGAQISYGAKLVGDLIAKENAAIAFAQAGIDQKDYEYAEKQMEIVQSAKKRRQEAAQNMIDSIQEAQRNNAINKAIIDSGFGDTADIVSKLQDAGYSVTAKEIADASSLLAVKAGVPDLSNLTGDVKNYQALKAMGELPPGINSLSGYINMVHSAERGSGSISGNTGFSDGLVVDPITNAPVSVGVNYDGTPNKSDQAKFLSGLPGGATGQVATLIKGLTDYQVSPSTFNTRNYKGSEDMTRSEAIALAKQYDPSYDETSYNTRAAMQRNVQAGPYSVTITASNTLIKHLGQLLTNYNALGNTGAFGFILNPAKNLEMKALGAGGVQTGVKTNIQAVASEAAKVDKGTASPSKEEINEWSNIVGVNSTPSDMNAFVEKTIDLMAGKLSTISENYSATMGKSLGYSFLTPESAKVLQSIGIDPTRIDPNYAQNPYAKIQEANSDPATKALNELMGSTGNAQIDSIGSQYGI